MKVINPTPIAGSVLVSTSLSEADYPGWLVGTTYGLGARVIVETDPVTHRIYESSVAGNVGNDPRTSPNKWIDIGPTNRWAMFDDAIGTSSVGTGSMTVVLAPGAVSALGLIDISNTLSVRAQVSVDGTTLYDVTKSTNAGGAMIVDWYAYFYADVGTLTTLTFFDLPSYSNAQVTVTITGTNPAGPVSVGALIVGTVLDLGLTEAGPTAGITDFSKKETNAYGATTVVERPYSKRMTTRSMVQTSSVDNIQRRVASLRAKPALYIGEDGYDALTVYGFFKDFSIDLALPTYSYVSLTIEGLV